MVTYSHDDVQLLADNGWVFLNPEYIYIPDDYDGCMAYGEAQIRKVIEQYRSKQT